MLQSTAFGIPIAKGRSESVIQKQKPKEYVELKI